MNALGGIGRLTEVRQRLVFVLIALMVYRLGAHLTIPGIDQAALAQMFKQQSGTILDMFNMFSGGALRRLSIFALGVMPYISASIIMQLMSTVIPSLEQLRKEGEQGRRQIMKYTRYGTLALALFQGIGITVALQNQGVVINPGPSFVFIGTVTLVTGTMFLMWLGEQITER
ncbi:MAG: preprotein translocase subunit SecY, partial [Ectothiorhodospiraceae bacterium]